MTTLPLIRLDCLHTFVAQQFHKARVLVFVVKAAAKDGSKMDTETKFTWVDTYTAIARKLLTMRNDEETLLEICENNANIGDTDRMDPFTFMSLFNRSISYDSRTKAIESIFARLDINGAIPTDYAGVPTSTNRRWRYMDGIDSSIEEKWDFFEEAMAYSPEDEDHVRFINLFDRVLAQKNIGFANLSMALFWCRPDTFMPFDQLSRNYLKSAYGILVTSSKQNGTGFLELLNKVVRLDRPLYEISAEAFDHKAPKQGIASEPVEESEQPVGSDVSSGKNSNTYTDDDFLNDVYLDANSLSQLKRLLMAKRNLILDGAPGTGKTFCAKRLAWSFMGKRDDSKIEAVQFHQGTTYEDFIIGYRPNDAGGFDIKEGVFTSFCQKAASDLDNDYFFLIDEINRANISKVFGELLSLIEAGHRGNPTSLAIDGRPFFVPDNVFIIGTMNTADRSIALIDYALRRRFAFFRMAPALNNVSFLKDTSKCADKRMPSLVNAIRSLNVDIASDPALGEGYEIGHSYLCRSDKGCVDDIVKYELSPLIREYWFDDRTKADAAISVLEGVINAQS